MKFKTTENDVAFFIEYENGKIDSFNTAEERDSVVDEIEADEDAWRSAK